MAESVYLTSAAIGISETPRHSAIVRITHWINAISFFGLLISGVAILLAHPRLYWGETGNIGTPSLIDLPLPFLLGGQSGWGRYQHFLFAWVCVLNGVLYIFSSLLNGHFGKHLLPARAELSWTSAKGLLTNKQSPGAEDYNVIQRLTYLKVIFLLFPLIIWTGLAMSPAIVSVFPVLVTILGGQQSARTIHFLVAVLLVLFVLVHIAMVFLAGFKSHIRAMITGRP